VQEIMSIAFLESYPSLWVADSTGMVYVWGMRPSLIRNQLLFKCVGSACVTAGNTGHKEADQSMVAGFTHRRTQPLRRSWHRPPWPSRSSACTPAHSAFTPVRYLTVRSNKAAASGDKREITMCNRR
jgi:hypothetical protein